MSALYHCTWTELVPKIRREGLRTLQTSNWVNREGKRQGKGELYAFRSYWDAVRWGAKMEWDYVQSTGNGVVTILHLREVGEWNSDFNDTLTQAAYEDQWVKTYQPIPAGAIVKIERLSTRTVRKLVARERERFARSVPA